MQDPAPYWFALSLAALGGLPSCHRAEKEEAQRIVQLIDQLRDAEPEQRGPFLKRLEDESIQGEAAERARQHCLTAYQNLYESQQLMAKVSPEFATLSPSPSAVADFARSKQMVDRATEEMPQCDGALGALRRLSR